jgi:hypothetical protein
MADAVAFRNQFRKGSAVYEVQCSDDVPRFLGNYDAITFNVGNAPYVDHKTSLAISYWRNPPTGIKEVLIGGPVTIVKRVA